VHPTWAETPLPFLQPVGNLLHRHHEPLLEDFTSIERVLLITERSRSGQALELLPFPVGPVADLERFEFGSVEVFVVPIDERWQVVSDLTSSLPTASAALHDPDGSTRRCGAWSLSDRSFSCDRRRADGKVRPVLLEVQDDPRRCVQAYPPPSGQILSVEFALEADDDVLRIRGGLDQRSARMEAGDDVLFRIFVDDELVDAHRLDAHASIWRPVDIPTAGDPLTLRVEVESVSPQPVQRRFCFNGWFLSAEQAQRSNR
jgi:hypothetical protein